MALSARQRCGSLAHPSRSVRPSPLGPSLHRRVCSPVLLRVAADDEDAPPASQWASSFTAAPPPLPAPAPPATAMVETAAAASPRPAAAPRPAPVPAPAAAASGHLEKGPWRPSAARTARSIQRLKVSLLAALSSLDRGLAANAREAEDMDALCSRLEGLGGPVALTRGSAVAAAAAAADGMSPTDLLSGTWRLVYSSGFNSGSLGGRRPGPPAAGFPGILGQVYQRIDPDSGKLDNIVELLFNYGPPDLGTGLGNVLEQGLAGLAGLGQHLPGPLRDAVSPLTSTLEALTSPPSSSASSSGGGGGGGRRESPAARLTLRHDYEITGATGVKICYEETFGELVGGPALAALPRLAAPPLPDLLKPPKFLRSASFDVTFLDPLLRITRGDRGELRVYLRDSNVSGVSAADLDYED